MKQALIGIICIIAAVAFFIFSVDNREVTNYMKAYNSTVQPKRSVAQVRAPNTAAVLVTPHLGGRQLPGADDNLFGYPFESFYPVTSPFGPRTLSISGQSYSMHIGIDIGAPIGTPILASRSGVVADKGFGPIGGSGYGYYIVVLHQDGYSTTYAHMDGNSELSVGANVNKGDVIGYSGNTGASTGPHLHFEIRKPRGDGGWGIPEDPALYIDFSTMQPKPRR